MLVGFLPVFELKTVVSVFDLPKIVQKFKVCNLLKEVCLPNIINN